MAANTQGLNNTLRAEFIRSPARETRGYKLFVKPVELATERRTQFLDITADVNGIIRESGIQCGLVHIQSLHTTTGLFLGEWQNALLCDMEDFLQRLVIRDLNWRHNNAAYSDCDRSNADSHLRGLLVGATVSVQVSGRAAILGRWQRILLAEFDGPRTRSVSVQVTGV